MHDSFLPTVGLARRAGKLLLGLEEFLAYRRSVFLILVAADASPRVLRTLSSRNAPFIVLDLTKEQLGRAVGCGKAAVIAVTDVGFADVIGKKLELQEENE